MDILKYNIFIFIICIFLLMLIMKILKNKETYSNKQKIIFKYPTWLNGQLFTTDIFPLKKYKFYNSELYGPNKVDKLLKFYSKNKKDAMKYANRKYGPQKGKTFKLTTENYKPANITNTNYKGKMCTQYTKRCNFYKSSNYYTPPCCASNLKEMIIYLHKLLIKHNIQYFIYWGTLLGSIRHGGIIPWDTDIDIYINEKDKSKLLKLKSFIEKDTHYILKIKNIIRLKFSKTNTQHIDLFLYKIK